MGNVESVQAIYEAFGRGDIAAILDRLADDVGWDLDAPGYGIPIYEPGVGKEHAKRFFEALRGCRVPSVRADELPQRRQSVAVPINIKVTVKATGKTVEALEIHLWTFGEGGKVSRFFHAIDRHALCWPTTSDAIEPGGASLHTPEVVGRNPPRRSVVVGHEPVEPVEHAAVRLLVRPEH